MTDKIWNASQSAALITASPAYWLVYKIRWSDDCVRQKSSLILSSLSVETILFSYLTSSILSTNQGTVLSTTDTEIKDSSFKEFIA